MLGTLEHLAPAADKPQPRATPLVLIVDDSPLDRRLASAILEKHAEVEVRTACDGAEALALIEQREPAVVLTDLQMPEMDGLQLVMAIRERHPLVPVILMTANGSEDIAIQALQAGAASYVPKRLISSELGPTVERVLSASVVDRRKQRLLECLRSLDCAMELENDPALVPPLVAHFQEHVLRMGLVNDHGKVRLGVALEEALLNAIYHGNLGLSSDLRQDGGDAFQRLGAQRRYESPYAARRVHLHVTLTPSEACFVIRDDGEGFNVAALPDPTDPENLLRVGGRGLLLIRTFMDEVAHNDKGNQVTLRKRRAPAKG